MDNADGIRFGISNLDRRRKFWAKYNKCDICSALPGNPCKMTEALGVKRTLSRPHGSRQLAEVKV